MSITKSEAYEMLAMLVAAFPGRFKADDSTAFAYVTLFADMKAADVRSAVVEHCAMSKWAPTIAELREIVIAKRLGLPGAGVAWEQVQRAIQYVGAHREPDWSTPAIADAVKAMGGFVSLCKSSTPMADRAHWLKVYGEYRSAATRTANVKPLLAAVGRRLELGTGEG